MFSFRVCFLFSVVLVDWLVNGKMDGFFFYSSFIDTRDFRVLGYVRFDPKNDIGIKTLPKWSIGILRC